MKYSLEILNDYIEKGLVVKNDHPSLPLAIYNYSRNCQYEGKWDEITMHCRGLILDNEGNVVAKTFPKFFNMEEHKPEEIPNEPFEVFEKLDGSLGILFNYNGEWILATKGSFVSDQAVRGMELLKKYNYDRLLKGFTYLFEIIYSENRIVCQYDYEDLVLLAVIDNKDGYELRIHDNDIHLEGIRFRNLYSNLGFKIVKKYDGVRDYSELKSKISQNQEGFVVKFGNGMRMKIKGEEYVRLHRILTGFSNVDIWEYLKDGKDLAELLDRVPDEFDKWVKLTVGEIKYNYFQLSERAGKLFDGFMYGKYNDLEPETDKKKFAEWVKTQHPVLQPILFRMFDKKEYSDYIWKVIKPKYSKPFWQKEIDL
jgi:RNA ligase